jgi:hypothetical protein
MSSDVQHYEVQLDSSEAVADGGVRRVTWLIETEQRWVLAAEYPGARVELRDRSAGVVFHRRVFVHLSPGAQVQKVESEPERRAARDLLDYLWISPRGPQRKVRRSFFRVGQKGQLERVARRA